MSPSLDEADIRIRDWLHRQPNAIVSAASSMRTVSRHRRKHSAAHSASTTTKKAKRVSVDSIAAQGSDSDGSTVWEDAVEEQALDDLEEVVEQRALCSLPARNASDEQITATQLLGTPFSSPQVPSTGRFEDTATPARSSLSHSADSTVERKYSYRSSGSLSTPPSSIDEHGTQVCRIAVHTDPEDRSKRRSRPSTADTAKEATVPPSSPSSPETASKVVPLSFGSRSRLKRNSMPVGPYTPGSPGQRRARAQSVTPVSEDADRQVLTFEWAPRPLILSPTRTLTSGANSPVSERASLMTRRTSSRISSPVMPPSPRLQAVDEERVTIHDGSLGVPMASDTTSRSITPAANKRLSVDVGIQTDPLPYLAPPVDDQASLSQHTSEDDRPDEAVLSTYHVLPTPASPMKATFLEGRSHARKGSDPGRSSSTFRTETRSKHASAMPDQSVSLGHQRRRSKSTSQLDVEIRPETPPVPVPKSASEPMRTSKLLARGATCEATPQYLDDWRFLAEPPPPPSRRTRSPTPLRGFSPSPIRFHHCLNSEAFISTDQLPLPTDSPSVASTASFRDHPSSSIPSLSSSTKKRRTLFGFGGGQRKSRIVSGPVLLPGGLPDDMRDRSVIAAGPSATLPGSGRGYVASSAPYRTMTGTVRRGGTMPTADRMALGPDVMTSLLGQRRARKSDKTARVPVALVTRDFPRPLAFGLAEPDSPLAPPELTQSDLEALDDLFAAPPPGVEPIADLLGGRRSRASSATALNAAAQSSAEPEEKAEARTPGRKKSVQFEPYAREYDLPPVPPLPRDVLQRE
jgi:hypothetical protein